LQIRTNSYWLPFYPISGNRQKFTDYYNVLIWLLTFLVSNDISISF
jgi:hypothetical protein